MQHIKSVANALENSKDLIVKILANLGDEFKDISSVIRARETSISFEELHEKLINFKAILKQDATKTQKFPITANYANKPSFGHHYNSHTRPNQTPNQTNSNNNNIRPAETILEP